GLGEGGGSGVSAYAFYTEADLRREVWLMTEELVERELGRLLALAAEAPDIVLPDGTAIDFKTYGRPCAACGDPCPAGQRWCSRSCHRAEDGDHSNEA
ncbi:MAG: hypothetical protein LC118_17490, partial [Dehalococcoidia bacterium]|nr:hypothetical protein [Dehalococcoidia bacterium]